jgi:hypothetical protein
VALSVALLLALLAAPAAAKWPHERQAHEQEVPASFDCAVRKLAYAYGKKLIPRKSAFESLFYALDLNAANCTAPLVADDRADTAPAVPLVPLEPIDVKKAVLVSPGDSIQDAVDRACKNTDGEGSRPTVLLRQGVHYLKSQLLLGPEHSGLTLASYPGEDATISGGKALDVAWTPYDTTNGANIWVADVHGQVDDVPGLQLDGVRATRARYPNLPAGIEASCGYGCMVAGKHANWTPPNFGRFGNVTYYTDMFPEHDRNDTSNGWFHHYMIGIHGLCSVYDPPVSYWCSEDPSGGGAFAFRTPSGVTPNDGALPHLKSWKNPEDAIWFVWRPARWANWMFETAKVEGGNNFTFGKGGNQGARGENSGGDFFVENVFEELDNPGEFYFDKREGKLYLWNNGTGAPAASATVVAPQKQVLVNMSGTQWNPVKNVNLRDIKYTATSYTYMERHGVPSAGDWALDRFAAVFLQGTENAIVDSCAFDRLDGNAVMISGYNRHATVQSSDFSYLGGNAIASWGYTNETATDPGRPGVAIENAPEAGVDGTDGEHPRYNTILSNTVREVGLYEKQSSFYIQAKTAQSTISGNVFFNGPRAGINANDGFGGGEVISHNLVFSTCRESGDHGPFNSWDRQPFLTTVRDGTPSMTPAWREIHHNFFIDNYSPQENVDNDDGSSYYKTHDNFFVYGGNGMKNDFGGHSNHHLNNVYAYVGQAIGFYDAPMLDGFEDHFSGNTVVMTGTNVGTEQCTGNGTTVMGNNAYYTPTGNLSECKMSLAQWQKHGHDLGSTVAKTPDDATIIGWAKAKLWGKV